jgi:hypothetical protein
MDALTQMRVKILPMLQSWTQSLKADHPRIAVDVFDLPVGSATDYQGHTIGIACTFPPRERGEADHVALAIVLKHLHTTPKIDSADVAWGHPSGHLEVDILPAPVDFSGGRLADLIAQLPKLRDGLQRAIRRGQPAG